MKKNIYIERKLWEKSLAKAYTEAISSNVTNAAKKFVQKDLASSKGISIGSTIIEIPDDDGTKEVSSELTLSLQPNGIRKILDSGIYPNVTSKWSDIPLQSNGVIYPFKVSISSRYNCMKYLIIIH